MNIELGVICLVEANILYRFSPCRLNASLGWGHHCNRFAIYHVSPICYTFSASIKRDRKEQSKHARYPSFEFPICCSLPSMSRLHKLTSRPRWPPTPPSYTTTPLAWYILCISHWAHDWIWSSVLSYHTRYVRSAVAISVFANIVMKTSRCTLIKSYRKTSHQYLPQFGRDSTKVSQSGLIDTIDSGYTIDSGLQYGVRLTFCWRSMGVGRRTMCASLSGLLWECTGRHVDKIVEALIPLLSYY